ncbi:DnaJ domain-containing protein [Vibrio sp. 404]|uniref:DnaJ domain-containing protein n=1 Tax=Vibrio marinisediminis TaxID=2758441 RepID=A0A7W2FS70_9VIBR|nr:DNA-J related domain-containing protein [Vibrio marinisediminis]MBA5763250.1 DnaJ domain-containing protein [Vibrio marinisediminis]
MPQQCNIAYANEIENPLVWPILEVLRKQAKGWKVHTLASELIDLHLMPQLDSSPEKDLFKRNFLLMNALYQLQETLYPDHYVQVESMNIALLSNRNSNLAFDIDSQDPLRDYYTDWSNYEAEHGEIRRLLDEFWTRYRDYVGSDKLQVGDITRSKALRVFELNEGASDNEVRKRWRKLALKWHPDRETGNSDHFRLVCEAWNVLRA